MATRLVTCYVAVCDLCGTSQHGEDYTPHLDTPAEAVQYVTNSGDEHSGWTLTPTGLLVCDQRRDTTHEDAHATAGKRMGHDAMTVHFT
ncbi:hypothetical protein [Streptomyces sp. NPDC047315]|uniref:hypothetical protein n=1 Tax=Streptomyces sp. NPDC047315 TaxID=3155142 RepID=UPI0033C7642D